MRIALAQIDTVVGDLDGNRGLILDALADARDAGADLVVYPELATTGYPPEDLLLRPAFARAARASVEQIAAETDGVVALVGTPWFDGDLANACAVCAGGEVRAYNGDAAGRALTRIFRIAATLAGIGGVSVGITICGDVWQPGPPATDLALAERARRTCRHLTTSARPMTARRCSPGRVTQRLRRLATSSAGRTGCLRRAPVVLGKEPVVDGTRVRAALLVVDVEPSTRSRRLNDIYVEISRGR